MSSSHPIQSNKISKAKLPLALLVEVGYCLAMLQSLLVP